MRFQKWSDWAQYNWPYLLLAFPVGWMLLGGFYAFAYRQGQQSVWWSAERAQVEAQSGK
jgi:hypothetical protein